MHLLTGPGCRRKPANWTLVSGIKSFPPIGGFSITDLNELKYEVAIMILEYVKYINQVYDIQKIILIYLLSKCPGLSIIPGKFGRNDESCSFNFFPLNLL